MDVTRALVLAGGGLAGIAWELGFLLGVQDESRDTATALVGSDLILGTSAGSVVGAQITSGRPLAESFECQLDVGPGELEPAVDLRLLSDMFQSHTDAELDARLRRIGAMASDVHTVSEQARREAIATRLPDPEWPAGPLAITATDIDTGDVVLFDRDAGVPLIDAVTASCAVPGVWPIVTIDGRRYMDGGVGSAANLRFAGAHDQVIVLRPGEDPGTSLLGRDLRDEVAGMTADVLPVFADTDSLNAFGTNPLSPSTRPGAAGAGRAQGRQDAQRVADFLTHGR
ncbi:MAG: patatin-like phospholipase family protein [Tomitella sp.]|nr:patatin-like phospholipase family protein [Tomitella sp.]